MGQPRAQLGGRASSMRYHLRRQASHTYVTVRSLPLISTARASPRPPQFGQLGDSASGGSRPGMMARVSTGNRYREAPTS
jgi:hypothetical protein